MARIPGPVGAGSRFSKALYACDELAGFLTAISYVKPRKSVFEVDAPSVRKKMKDKAFARSVNRDDSVAGARELGVDLDEHIAFCVKAMQDRAAGLGLSGTPEVAPALLRAASRLVSTPGGVQQIRPGFCSGDARLVRGCLRYTGEETQAPPGAA